LSKQAKEPLGLLIAIARRRIKQVAAARAAEHGVTMLQFWVLVGLVEGGSQSLRELAERTRIDDPMASRVVQTLVSAGYVAARNDENDRRRARLVLTARGRTLAERLAGEADAIRILVERDLTPREGDAARAALRKVIATLEKAS
jgi:MarR family transcriptional regulator, organic hydroperoxide resistance regulator